VRYVDPETDGQKKDDKSWMSKLMFWKGGKSDISKAAQYRVYVKGGSDQSTVKVLTREGGTDVSDTSKKILGLLFEQLK
jgi:outer membrane protein assembly factor BamC